MSAQSHSARNAGRFLMVCGLLVIAGAFAFVFWMQGVNRIDQSLDRLLVSLFERRQDAWQIAQTAAAVASSFLGALVACIGWLLVKLTEQQRAETLPQAVALQQAA